MKIFFLSAIVLALSASGSLSAAVGSNQPNQANNQDPANSNELTNNLTATIFDFVAENQPGNVVVSGGSISTLLKEFSAGATGETKQQAEAALNVKSPQNLRNLEQLINQINNTASKGLTVAAITLIPKGQELNAEFQQNSKQVYGAQTNKYNNDQQATELFNTFLKQFNNPQNVLKPADPFSNAALVIGNAGRFVGELQTPFNPQSSKKDAFYLNNNLAQYVTFMRQVYDDAYYGYIPESDAVFFQLPLKQKEYNVYLLAANDFDANTNITDKLIKYYLNQIKISGRNGKILVEVPESNGESYLNLEPTMEYLGLGELYQNNANLNGYYKNGQNLKISQVNHAGRIQLSKSQILVDFASNIVAQYAEADGASNGGASSNPSPNQSNQSPNQSNQSPNQYNQSPNQYNQSPNQSNQSPNQSSQSSNQSDDLSTVLPVVQLRFDRGYYVIVEHAESGHQFAAARIVSPDGQYQYASNYGSEPNNNAGANNNARPRNNAEANNAGSSN